MKSQRMTKQVAALFIACAAGAVTFGVGSSLVRDVGVVRAEQRPLAPAVDSIATMNDLSSAYKRVNLAVENTVVQLIVTKSAPARQRMQLPQFNDPELRRFFDRDNDGAPDGAPDEDAGREQATGSGVIIDAKDGDAFIVTNNHVIESSTEITIVFNDGRRVTGASVVGADPKTDVAVVKVKVDGVSTAKWGDSDALEKGDIIVAFGSPFGYVGSMSHGIVSALNRQAGVISNSFAYENFIQVDAPINPGNSGGPLVNLNGEVVGINTAIASRTGSFAGIGFAIPSNQVKSVYTSLVSTGRVVRGYLGVMIADVRTAQGTLRDAIDSVGYKGEKGVFVNGVQPDSPALNVLKPGDVVTEINGKTVNVMADLRNKIAMTSPGIEVTLKVWRDGKLESIRVKLAEQPEVPVALGGRPAPAAVGQLGVSIGTPTADELEAAGVPADTQGAFIKQVQRGSLAARIGLRPGDVITRVGNKDITSADDAREALKGADFKKGIGLHILNREGQRMVFARDGRE